MEKHSDLLQSSQDLCYRHTVLLFFQPKVENHRPKKFCDRLLLSGDQAETHDLSRQRVGTTYHTKKQSYRKGA